MSCATSSIKYTLFILNTLWAILGLLVITFAGFGWDAMPKKYAIGLIVLGGVIITIAFFGCTGAIRESPRMLWTYVAFVFVLLILIIVFMCLNTRDVFKKYALQGVDDQWEQEIKHEGAMDTVQETYCCCGRQSAEDYYNIGRDIPASCCKDKNCINPLNVYIIGCLTKVEEAFSDEASTTQLIEWLIFGFDLTIFVLSVILAIHYTNRRRRFDY